MAYTIAFTRRAQRCLRKLTPDVRERVLKSIQSLAQNPRPQGCIKLTDREEWRIRIGEYRILYEIDDTVKEILIVFVGHRSDAYE